MQTDKGIKQHSKHIRRLEKKRKPDRLNSGPEYQIIIGAYIDDPLGLGSEIIKTEPPELLNSILKKEYSEDEQSEGEDSTENATDTTSKQPDNETPPQSKVFTESRRSGPKWPGGKA
ncbi:hypothetical protein BASA50_005901 [Batrachochytrium salamandrivorans]|uniref:Uncharacterized protein n=1 Tax=Batrachochytrium salamandrivorans TaxID=1357716 RepID=A0ABQ8FEG8_9FUNG|nr:hypothetical protein BASA62_003077 [Batrachochytrium salamandrivorans]KAH6595383.1 hypothetical protein BASA50_005901 [Batrachochytrium salamandrivorans]